MGGKKGGNALLKTTDSYSANVAYEVASAYAYVLVNCKKQHEIKDHIIAYFKLTSSADKVSSLQL